MFKAFFTYCVIASGTCFTETIPDSVLKSSSITIHELNCFHVLNSYIASQDSLDFNVVKIEKMWCSRDRNVPSTHQ